MSLLVSPSVAIHIVAHLCNLERYHLSRSAEAEGLPAALSELGDAPNESYLNPIRTVHAVSSLCSLPTFSSVPLTIRNIVFQMHLIKEARDEKFLPNVNISFTL